MDTSTFLHTVITAPEGWFCLAVRDDNWREMWYQWPQQEEEIVDEAKAHTCDVYFSSYLFEGATSRKSAVRPSRTIQADLDNADVLTIELPPSVLVQTSRGRHQGFWILNEQLELEQHERLSKKVTYGIPLCDRSGWPLGRKVRLPNTNNCKYNDTQLVTVQSASGRIYHRNELEQGFDPDVELSTIVDEEDDFLARPLHEFDVGPYEMLERVRDKIPPKVAAQYNQVADDRSEALWALECALFRAGLDRYEVFFLAFHSANNKFRDLRVNANRELAKDVQRAEKTGVIDPRAAMMAVRAMKLPKEHKSRLLADTAISAMKMSGSFARGRDTVGWYVYQGHPIPVVHKNSVLTAHLENQLGLNATEPEQHYVANALVSYTQNLPATTQVGAISLHDRRSNTLYLHTGRKQVLKITNKGLSASVNGAEGIIFPWQLAIEPFVPLESDINWAEVLFGDSLTEVEGIERNDALVLLRVWLLFILLRDFAQARPILAIFGEPGSGKSAMLRRVFAVFYGREKSIGGITNPEDFDTQTSNFPFVVFDNVDTWEGWLPDRLAQVINNTDVERRMLYTNNEIYSIKRQAMVALTAHDPKFGRADVVDRLLILTLKRLPSYRDEQSMYEEALDKRNYIWGALINDLMAIMKFPRFVDLTLQFRIQDFATVGLWISRALDIEQPFRNAIQAIKMQQKSFILEEENLLVDCLLRVVKRGMINGKWITIGDLWEELEFVAPDMVAFQRRYKNTTVLSRRLHTLRNSLNSLFSLEWKEDGLTRRWKLG